MKKNRLSLLRRTVNFDDPASLAIVKRRARFRFFWSLVEDLPKPVRILDIGGTQEYWTSMECDDPAQVHVTLVNLYRQPVSRANFVSVVGDGTRLHDIGENEFDIAFSNSVIEHCGAYERQQAMANEIRRVGKRYYVQSPSFWFPMEPHFLFPGFQWLPVEIRVALVKRFDLGWVRKWPEPLQRRDVWGVPMTCYELVESIRILTGSELSALFPEGRLFRERFLGLTKSLIIYGEKQAMGQMRGNSGTDYELA